jgi:uncharacterized protein YjbJ (UPF0337 family)
MGILSPDSYATRGEVMTDQDKARNKSQELKGKVKEGVGRATDDEELEAKGRSDQTKGSAKQAGEKLKDAAKGLTGK